MATVELNQPSLEVGVTAGTVDSGSDIPPTATAPAPPAGNEDATTTTMPELTVELPNPSSALVLGPSCPPPQSPAIPHPLPKTCQAISWSRIPAGTTKSGEIPLPRHGHRAVSFKHLIVMFSGGNEGLLGGVNVFNTLTNEWFQPNVKGRIPPARASFGMAIDGVRILVFGGMHEHSIYSNDLYELNIQKWEWTLLKPTTKLAAEIPCPRIGHSFTIVRERAFLFGGLADIGYPSYPYPRYLNDTNILMVRLNQQNGIWMTPTTYGQAPSPRESHTAVAYTSKDQRHNKIVIFGGMNGFRLSDMFTLDVDTYAWTQIMNNRVPRARSLHSATVVLDRMYVFGGWTPPLDPESDEPHAVDNTTFCLNLRSMVWESVQERSGERPAPRAGHCAVNVFNRIFILGGRNGFARDEKNKQVCFNDTWALDVTPPTLAPGKVALAKASPNGFLLEWSPAAGAAGYLLQCQKFDAPAQVGLAGESGVPQGMRIKPETSQFLYAPLIQGYPTLGPMEPVQMRTPHPRIPFHYAPAQPPQAQRMTQLPRTAFIPESGQTPMSFEAFTQTLQSQGATPAFLQFPNGAPATSRPASRLSLTGTHGIPRQFPGPQQIIPQTPAPPPARGRGRGSRKALPSITVPIRTIPPPPPSQQYQFSGGFPSARIRRTVPRILLQNRQQRLPPMPPPPAPPVPIPPSQSVSEEDDANLEAVAAALLTLGGPGGNPSKTGSEQFQEQIQQLQDLQIEQDPQPTPNQDPTA